MKTRLIFGLRMIFLVLVPYNLYSQGESALPFLLITSSPEGNGMAGISASVLTDNAMASIANPGQLGLQSLTNFLSASTYAPKTQWLPAFQVSDLTYLASSVNVGVNLRRVIPLPIPISVGLGYSHVFLNLGKFVETVGDPTPGTTYDTYEQSDGYTLGLGVDYFIRAGIGFTAKNVKSILGPPSSAIRVGTAEVSTTDFGTIVQVPTVAIISKLHGGPVTLFPNVEPIFDITLGYARSNLGDKDVEYSGIGRGGPLPRTATIGLSWKAGLISHAVSQGWEIFSVTIAREALDVLVGTSAAGSWSYQNGLGDLQVFDNLILGKSNQEVWLRKGFQIGLGEILMFRIGSLRAPFHLNLDTDGYSLRLGGVFKLFVATSTGEFSAPILNFIIHHIDFQYDHASETQLDGGPRSGTTYSALNLIIK